MTIAINFNFFFLNQLCMYAKYGQLHELSHLGLSATQMTQLMNMSASQLEVFSAELGKSILFIDSSFLQERLDGVIIPPLCRDLLKYGASNDILKDLLNVSKNTCSYWRGYVQIPSQFKKRTLPIKGYKKLWDEIYTLQNSENPTAEELITLAKNHNVSITAIWLDINKGNDDET